MKKKWWSVVICALALCYANAIFAKPEKQKERNKASYLAKVLRYKPFYFELAEDPSSHESFCKELFQAFQGNLPAVGYPEPIVRTENINHPVLNRYRKCESDEYLDKNAGLTGYFFSVPTEIGTKHFRIYRLDIDDNPSNGLEEIIYGENAKGLNSGYGGYYLISMNSKDGCTYRRDVGIMEPSVYNGATGKLLNNENALINYKKNYYVYELQALDGAPETQRHYLLKVNKISGGLSNSEEPDKAAYCMWSTVAPNK